MNDSDTLAAEANAITEETIRRAEWISGPSSPTSCAQLKPAVEDGRANRFGPLPMREVELD